MNIEAVVRELEQALEGEVSADTGRLAQYSTDASNYRIPPQVVALPRGEDDVVAAVRIAAYHGLPVTVRGGGTSCSGNAVGPGLVLDVSRHMNRVVSIDPEARTAVVQPGVVLADLQTAAAAHGLRFGPDPSTATRCTLGGMIGNNACGPHGLAYGRTADNVRKLRWLTGTGEVLELTAGQDSLDAVPGLKDFVMANLGLIRTEFGRFGRQISGYSLEHLLPENGWNIPAALAGTEGTCGIILEAEVDLVPRSAAPALAVLGYPDMASAADAVPALLPHKPLALEGLDAALVETIRNSPRGATMPTLPKGNGWLMVEVGGADDAEALAAAQALVRDAGALDAVVLPSGPEAKRLWQVRSDGAGLAGRTAAGAQAWPGWEDSAVPPEHLGDYLRDLAALMERRNLSGLAYGHFGDGCVHLRIDFPLEAGGEAMRGFLTEAAELVARYGGSLSGEHGDGRARGELLHTMYSPEAIAAFSTFKTFFDPAGVLNPGVVVDPDPLDASLRRPQAVNLLASDGFAFAHDGGNITDTLHRCVGVGKCRADLRQEGGFMCPSFQATRDEAQSTRGRARVLQEMLNGGIVEIGWSSPEVHDALDLCLSCKACANDCPTGIDMAMYKSEALHQTYKGRLRPLAHYTFGRLPQWLRLAGPFGPLINTVSRVEPLRKLMMRLAGADPRRGLPVFPERPFRALEAAPIAKVAVAQADSSSAMAEGTGGHPVLLWVDSFSDAMGPEVALAAVKVLRAADCDVQLAGPGVCCGLTLITTGQLTAAKAKLTKTLDVLHPQVEAGRTVVGLEPSCTAVLRSDLLELLPDDPRSLEVSRATKTVAEFLGSIGWTPPAAAEKLLVQPHCHQHSVMGYQKDLSLLQTMGCDVEVSSGCCGLAGNFGMEKGHYEISAKIAEDGILKKASADPERAIMADGFSCRTQVADLAGLDSRHLVQVIADALDKESTLSQSASSRPVSARSCLD
ncbi:FAD-binding and (Fe-S)-binding domain-containing protein [Crystallibacter degradans]|uniref:FAD-binding and (Fe-S)-binding domain-containing protein n=1 Tax=Crystallibacter degradans TaxID=2726743 RepID=UPI001474FE81|nr:FAD-binding and (Fe-S)-binding domain-containing protein [Arthrobacter sp. SF27]NMR29140.1 FAD-binding oxidoreductase [Arthrobacter sp. SF27]